MRIVSIKTLFLLSLVFVSACSTSSKKYASKNINDLDDEFNWLENKDFKKVSEIKYKSPSDVYPEKISNSDSLAKESVARLSSGKLDDVSDSDDLISKVVGRCYQKDFSSAQELIRKNRKKYIKNPSFWNQVGSCYFLQGEKRKALIFYNKAINLNKRYAPAINNLGVLHQADGHDQRALAAYDEAMKLSSFSLTPNFNKAQIYLKYGFVKKAERIFVALWKKNKRDRDVVHALAVIYMQQKKYEKSVSAFQALNYDTQELPGVALNYALALALSGQKEKAQKVLKGLSEKNIDLYASYFNKVRKVVGR